MEVTGRLQLSVVVCVEVAEYPDAYDIFNSLKGSLTFKGRNGEEKQIILNNCEDFAPQWQISPPCYSGR